MDQYQWFLVLYSSIHQWPVSSNFWCRWKVTKHWKVVFIKSFVIICTTKPPTLNYAHPYLSCFVLLDSVCWNPLFVGWNSSWLRQESVTSCQEGKKKQNRVSLITDSVQWNQRAMIEERKNVFEHGTVCMWSYCLRTDENWLLLRSDNKSYFCLESCGLVRVGVQFGSDSRWKVFSPKLH